MTAETFSPGTKHDNIQNMTAKTFSPGQAYF